MAGHKIIKDKDGLDEKERRFVHEYLIDQNAERAAIAAGYSPGTAHTVAYGWASKSEGPKAKPAVYAAIRKVLDAKLKRLDITSDRILDQLARIAFFNAADILPGNQRVRDVDLTTLTVDQAAALGELVIDNREKKRALKVKPWGDTSRIAALNMLARYRNLLTPDAAITVEVNQNIGLAERLRRAKDRKDGK